MLFEKINKKDINKTKLDGNILGSAILVPSPVINPVGYSDGVIFFKNKNEASEYFWSEVNRKGLFSLMFIFTKLKFRNNYNPINTKCNPFNDTKLNKEYFKKLRSETNIFADLTGGFIKRSQLPMIARKIGYKENTIRIAIGKLTKLGLLKKTHTGWIIVSMSKASLIVANINLPKLKIKGNTKDELKSRHAYCVIKRVGVKQGKVMHKTDDNVSATLSCRTLANKLGYKSAMTANYRERKLEVNNKIVVVRHELETKVFVDDYGNKIKEYKNPCNLLKILR